MASQQPNFTSFFSSEAAAFTADDIRHFSDKQLKELALFDVQCSVIVDPIVRRFAHERIVNSAGRPRNVNPAEAQIISQLMSTNARVRTRVVSTDEYVRDTASVVVETPKATHYVSHPQAEVPRSAIPYEGSRRVGDVNLVSFISLMVDIKEGKWISILNISTLKKVIGPTIDALRLVPFARSVAQVLTQDKTFRSMELSAKNALTGPRRAHWLVGWANRLPLFEYLFLHSSMLYQCTSFYKKDVIMKRSPDAPYNAKLGTVEGWDATAGLIYAASLTSAERASFDENFPKAPPVVAIGPLPVKINMPEVTNAAECRAAIQLAGSLSSVKHVPYYLYSNRGYSGFLSDMGKRVCLIVSVTAGLMSKGHNVDIYLYSIGDMGMLKASLDSMIKKMDLKTDYRFIVSRTLFPQVDKSIRADSARPEAAKIYFTTSSEATIDTDKGSTWESNAKDNLIFDLNDKNPWVYIGHVYGMHMFGEVEAEKSPNVEAQTSPKSYTPHAYEFGDCSSMRGVLSNVALQFLAYEYKQVTSSGELIDLKPPCHSTSLEWYKAVVRQCGQKVAAWINPIPRYNPINNWLVGPPRSNALNPDKFLESGGLTQEDRDLIMQTRREVVGYVPESFDWGNMQAPMTTASSASLVPSVPSPAAAPSQVPLNPLMGLVVPPTPLPSLSSSSSASSQSSDSSASTIGSIFNYYETDGGEYPAETPEDPINHFADKTNQ